MHNRAFVATLQAKFGLPAAAMELPPQEDLEGVQS
jgi:hypothetical protein